MVGDRFRSFFTFDLDFFGSAILRVALNVIVLARIERGQLTEDDGCGLFFNLPVYMPSGLLRF